MMQARPTVMETIGNKVLVECSLLEAIPQALEEAREAFHKGDRSAVMEVVFACACYQAVMPEWVVDALLDVQRGMAAGEIKDFNEAFGAPKSRTDTRRRIARLKRWAHETLSELMHLRTEGFSFNAAEIFAEAADRLKIRGVLVNARDVEDIYRQGGSFLKEIPRKPQAALAAHAIAKIDLPSFRRHGRPILKDEEAG